MERCGLPLGAKPGSADTQQGSGGEELNVADDLNAVRRRLTTRASRKEDNPADILILTL